MRKIIFASLLSILTIYAFGQEEGKFRGNAGLGVAIPSGGAGFLFNMEGNYNITDNFNAGVRIGWAIMAKNIETDEDGFATEADVGANASYLATAEYFFPNRKCFYTLCRCWSRLIPFGKRKYSCCRRCFFRRQVWIYA